MSASDGYPEEFGFRISEGTVPEPISVQLVSRIQLGMGRPNNWDRTGISPHISNPGNWHDTTIGETRSTLLAHTGHA